MSSGFSNEPSEPKEDEHAERGVADAALFVCITLLIGLLCRNILPGLLPFPAPYTVLLLVTGVLIGTMNQFLPREGVQLYAINEEWANVDPHVILIVFLPTLIFESAFSIDFHVFRKSFWQIFSLAFPGMVIGTLLTAAITNSLFDYDWEFSSHLMLGSILAATDPVAVVALLKELGAAKPLETLIEGESLLNDGTAIVAFSIFRGLVTETIESSAGTMIGFGVQLAIVGPLMGALFAAICTFVLGYIYNDAISEVTWTVAACYTSFAVAEGTDLHTSGVLAVVTLGVLMSGYAKTRVSPEVEHTMHSFWELLGYVANTIIFLLAGLIIAEKALFSDYVRLAEFAYLLVLYIALHAVRVVCVLACYPVLLWSGYPMDWRSAIVLSYAGLRGAVGLSLGLIVEQDENIDITLRERVLFYVAGIAFLTLLINGSTTKFLLNYLGLGKETPVQKRMFEHACDLMNTATSDSARSLTAREEFAMADWSAVWSYMPVYTQSTFLDRVTKGRVPAQGDQTDAPTRVMGRWERYRVKYDPVAAEEARIAGICGCLSNMIRRWGCGCCLVQSTPAMSTTSAFIDSPEQAARDYATRTQRANSLAAPRQSLAVRAETRRRFIAASRAAYWHRHEEGLLGRDALRLLLLAESEELDETERSVMRQWELLEGLIELPSWLKFLRQFEWLNFVSNSILHGYVGTAYDVAVGFAHGQAAVRRAKSSWAVSTAAGDAISAESTEQQKHAEDWADRLRSGYPQVCRSVQTQQAALALLTNERHTAMKLHREGGIDEKQLGLILHHNNTSFKKASGHPAAVMPKTLAELLPTSGLAGGSLSAATIALIVGQAKDLVLDTNKFVFRQGSEASGIVLVLEGSIAVFASTSSGASVKGFDTRVLASDNSATTSSTSPDDAAAKSMPSPIAGLRPQSPAEEAEKHAAPSGRGDRIARQASFRVQTRTERVAARRVGPGSIVAAAEVLLGTRHSTSAVTATNVSAVSLPVESVRMLMLQSTPFVLQAWRSAAAHIAHVFLDTFAGHDRADVERALEEATIIVPWGTTGLAGAPGVGGARAAGNHKVTTEKSTDTARDPLVSALLPPRTLQVPVLADKDVLEAAQGGVPGNAIILEGEGRQFLGSAVAADTDTSSEGRGGDAAVVANPLDAARGTGMQAGDGSSSMEIGLESPVASTQGDCGVHPAGRTIGYGKQGWLLLQEDTCILMRGALLRSGGRAVKVQAFHTIWPGPHPLRFSRGSVLVRIPKVSMDVLHRTKAMRDAAGRMGLGEQVANGGQSQRREGKSHGSGSGVAPGRISIPSTGSVESIGSIGSMDRGQSDRALRAQRMGMGMSPSPGGSPPSRPSSPSVQAVARGGGIARTDSLGVFNVCDSDSSADEGVDSHGTNEGTGRPGHSTPGSSLRREVPRVMASASIGLHAGDDGDLTEGGDDMVHDRVEGSASTDTRALLHQADIEWPIRRIDGQCHSVHVGIRHERRTQRMPEQPSGDGTGTLFMGRMSDC